MDVSFEVILNLIFSFLGGGLVAGLLDWLRHYFSEKKNSQISALQNQIQNLYGPLYFFASQNESYFELNTKFHEAYKKEYIGPNWSLDKETQANLRNETTQVLDIANAYIALVVKNNESILEVLQNNYAYIDPDDIDIFRQLVIDYTRLKMERDETGTLKTPIRIYEYVGEISFMRSQFIERVRERFNSKKKKLDELLS